MVTGGYELPLLVIKTGRNGERLSSSSSRLYRKNSMPHSIVEVYYGGASESVAIPFGWESQPGTPKVVFRDKPLPPLTPPPSFILNTPQTPGRKRSKPKPSLLYKLTPGRKSFSPASPASSASYSSSSSPGSFSRSVPSSPYSQGEIQFSNARGSSFESRRPKEDGFGSRTPLSKEDEFDSPVSTLCFGIRCGTNSRSRGGFPRIMKVLLGES